MPLTVTRRELPFRPLRNLQKEINQVFELNLKTAMEQIRGIIETAPPNMNEEVVRGSLKKTLRDTPASLLPLVKYAQRFPKDKFVSVALGCPTEDEDRALGDSEYMDQRRAKCWMISYAMFRGQGMKEEQAREAVNKDPEYLRLKNLTEATKKVHSNCADKYTAIRQEFYSVLEGVRDRIKDGEVLPATKEQWEEFWETANSV